MENLEILVISTNPELMEVILRLVNNKEGWTGTGTGAESIEKSKEIFTASPKFDIVLFDVGVSEAEEKELTAIFKTQNSEVIAIRHYGGGSGLLYNEVQAALEDKNSV